MRRPHENAKIGIVRSSQANRRPNVTKASVKSTRDSVRYPLKVCGDPTTTVRPPCILYQNVKGLRADIAQASYDIHLESAETYDHHAIRSSCALVSERREKADREIVRYPYEL